MKRILLLALALMMALGLVTAHAADDVPAALCRIVLREEGGDVTLGSGVLFGSSRTVLTAAGVWAEGDLYVITTAGTEHAVSHKGIVAGSQLITLGLATPAAAEPMTITTADYLLDYNLYGVKADGSFVSMPVLSSRNTVIDNRAEVLLYAQEGLLPGAVMLGDDEGLACLSVYQMGEGEGCYAAVADVTLGKLFAASAEDPEPHLLTGVTASYADGHIIVDWSASSGYLSTEDTIFTVCCTTLSNTYFSSHTLTQNDTSTTFPAIPGTEAMVWVTVSQGEPDSPLYPESAMNAAFVTVPQPEPFTLNGLKNIRMGITPGEPGLEGVTTDFIPQVTLTREVLADRSRPMYFQTEDTYTCTEEDDAHTLMVILYTPEGYSFYYYSGYIFMPDYAQSDLWASDVSKIFEDYERFCEGEPWPAGEYTFLYTIDGGEVARFTITLE